MRQSGLVSDIAVTIGHQEHEHLIIRVLGRMHPEARDRWDGNWLLSPIELAVGDFRGTITGAGLRGDELRVLRRGLERMHENLAGDASLDSMEQWLDLKFNCDSAGRIEVTGAAYDHRGSGANALHFSLQIDQTFLGPIIESLKAVEATYEVFEGE